jgi:hypothetical protein
VALIFSIAPSRNLATLGGGAGREGGARGRGERAGRGEGGREEGREGGREEGREGGREGGRVIQLQLLLFNYFSVIVLSWKDTE